MNRHIDIRQWIAFDGNHVCKNSRESPARRATVAGRGTPVSEVCMDIQDAQRESRSVYIGGFWGQLVSSIIWLVSAALGTWVTPKASILAAGKLLPPLAALATRTVG